MNNTDKYIKNKFSDGIESESIKANLGRVAKRGIFWTFFYNNIQIIIRFLGSIALARLLYPEDFGLMAIASIVFQLAHRLTNFGFAMVLVQKEEIRQQHYDTVFITNLILVGTLTIVLFISSPLVAEIFDEKKIEPIVRIMSINFILLALTSVPKSILRRNMMFREIEITNTTGQFVAVLSPICFAVMGYGVYSLVFGTILGSLISCAGLTYFSNWLPRLKFNLQAFKDVFSFGLWIYIGSYVKFGINKIDFFIIGKLLGAYQLGIYERAFNLMSLPRRRIFQKINSVLFSTYSKIQYQDERIVKAMLKVVTYISLIIYPLMVWLFFGAPSLIKVLFGAKWVGVVYSLKIMCIAAVMDSLTLVFEPIILARGLIVNRTLRDFCYLLFLGTMVFVGVRWGIIGVAWGTTIASIFQLGLSLNLMIKRLPFTMINFINAQKSAIIYSIILIIILKTFQYLTEAYFANDSLLMMISQTLLSAIVILGSHLLIRFKDVDTIYYQFIGELRKFPGFSHLKKK